MTNTQAIIAQIDKTIAHLEEMRRTWLAERIAEIEAGVSSDYPPSAAHEDERPYLGTGDRKVGNISSAE